MTDGRNLALDFTKGCLVVGMVLYHSLDYFADQSFLYRYVRFITGAFVFISGFLVSNIYLKKYNIYERRIYHRLLSRGIKLIIIFSLLNVAINLIFGQNYDGRELCIHLITKNIYSIYFSGNSKLAAFEILLPIAYFLLVSGGLVYVVKEKLWIVTAISLVLFCYCTAMFFDNQHAFNLRYITVGLIGFTFGLMLKGKIDNIIMRRYLVILAYTGYSCFITFFDLYYPVYVGSVLISLMLIYMVGLKAEPKGAVNNTLMLLGRYSLLAYLVQILILQMLTRVFGLIDIRIDETVTAFIVTTAVMILCIETTNYLKNKSGYVDKVYRIIFC